MPDPLEDHGPPIKGEVTINGGSLDLVIDHPRLPFACRGQSFSVQPNGQVQLSDPSAMTQFFTQQGMEGTLFYNEAQEQFSLDMKIVGMPPALQAMGGMSGMMVCNLAALLTLCAPHLHTTAQWPSTNSLTRFA